MEYLTNCVNSTAGDIGPMVDKAREISYATFLQYVDVEELQNLFAMYEWQGRKGLKLKDDYAVSFFKSVFKGRKCVYIEHSMIEYVFV